MGGGGKGGGGKKGGGGGGLPPIQVGIQGAFDIQADTKSALTADTKSALALTADTKSALNADTKSALTADTKSALDTALKAEVDLKPLAVDLCLKLGLDRLPSTSVCRDGNRHFGIRLFGVEVIGFDYSADSKTEVEDLSQRAFVIGKRTDHHPGIGAQGVRIRIGD